MPKTADNRLRCDFKNLVSILEFLHSYSKRVIDLKMRLAFKLIMNLRELFLFCNWAFGPIKIDFWLNLYPSLSFIDKVY